MYSIEEIKELLKAFDNSKATRLHIAAENGETLTITQKSCQQSVSVPAAAPVVTEQMFVEKQTAAPFIREEEEPENDGRLVTSPMVGVFYAAPSPDKDPYVTVGSKVQKGDVLCLIEAMKLMNEVTAEQSGEITDICVDNGQVVEYGQTLFKIK